MPSIPQYYREQRLAATAGNAVLSGQDIYQMTSGYRENAKAGQALTEFGAKYLKLADEAEAVDQLNTAQTEAASQLNSWEQSLAARTDTDKWMGEFDQLKNNIKNTVGKGLTNRRARDAFDRWYADEQVNKQNRTFWTMHGVKAKNQAANLDANGEKWVDMGATASNEKDYANAKAMITKLYKEAANLSANPETGQWELNPNGASFLQIDPATADLKIEAAISKMDAKRQQILTEGAKKNFEVIAVDMAAAETEKAIAAGKTPSQARKIGYDAAFNWMDDPKTLKEYIKDVPLEDQQSVLDDIKGRLSYRKAQEEEAARNLADADAAEIQKRIREKNLDGLDEIIRKSNLPETGDNSKEHWYGVMDATIKAMDTGDALPVNQSDPVVEAAIMTAIDAGDKKVTPEYINSLIGKGRKGGLSGGTDGTAQKLIAKLKSADTPQNRWRNAITATGTSYLKNLEQAEVFGVKNSPESAEKLANTELQWQAWREEHPDATQEEGMAYLKELTKKERKAKWVGTSFDLFGLREGGFPEASAFDIATLKQLAARERQQKKNRRQYVSPLAPEPDTSKYKDVVINPETGQMMVWDGKEWKKWEEIN